MSTIITYSLIAHVILSIVGLIASYAVVMFLLQRSLNLGHLKAASMTGFMSYFLSGLFGLYILSAYYLPELQDTIKNGQYAWAESFVWIKSAMLAIVTIAMLYMVLKIVRKQDQLTVGSDRQKFLIKLGSFTLALSILMVMAGVIVAGAGR